MAAPPSASPSGDAPPCGSKHDNWRDPRVAGEYDARRFGGLRGRLKQGRDEALLRRILDAGPGVRTVLDLPSGTGRLLGALGAGGRTVVAADRAVEMLCAGPAATAAPRVQADARALPFADRSFDAVVSYRFLFHVRARAERVAVLAEMARVARTLVVVQVRERRSVKQAGRWLRSQVGLARHWSPAPGRAANLRELEEAGLRLERVVPVARLTSDKALLVARPSGPPLRA